MLKYCKHKFFLKNYLKTTLQTDIAYIYSSFMPKHQILKKEEKRMNLYLPKELKRSDRLYIYKQEAFKQCYEL